MKVQFDVYATIDIETNECGQPTDFGYYSTATGFVSFTGDQLLEFCYQIVEGEASLVYAHNGMGFDYPILLGCLLTFCTDFNIALSGTAGLFASFKYKKRQMYLLDSYRLLPASLASLTKQFGVTRKIDLSGLMPWELDSASRIEYLRHDCVGLYETIASFWHLIDGLHGHVRAITLASLAYKIFVKMRGARLINSSGKLEKFESKSYYGGIVWCNSETAKSVVDVNIYDVNSMYPFTMSDVFPCSYTGGWTNRFERGCLGLYHVEFSYPVVGIPFVFNTGGCLSFSGEAVLDGDTLEYLLTLGGAFRVITGYVYQDTDYVFREFVSKHYELRKTHSKDEPINYIAKILLNSLYGKFAEKNQKRCLSTVFPANFTPNSNCKIYSSGGSEVFDYTEYAFVSHRFPVISSLVTLRARLLLKRLTAGVTPYYCDTDSIHVPSDQFLPVSNELGGLKLEFSGRGIYLGKKIYQLYDSNDKVVKTVAKGIPKGSLINSDFRDMPPGGFVYSFMSFSSLLTTIKDPVRDFRIVKRTRTLKPTV